MPHKHSLLIPWFHQVFKMVITLNNSMVHLENCFICSICLVESLSAVDSVLLTWLHQGTCVRLLSQCFWTVCPDFQHSVVWNDKPLSMLMFLLCCFMWHSISWDYIAGMWLWYRYVDVLKFSSSVQQQLWFTTTSKSSFIRKGGQVVSVLTGTYLSHFISPTYLF